MRRILRQITLLCAAALVICIVPPRTNPEPIEPFEDRGEGPLSGPVRSLAPVGPSPVFDKELLDPVEAVRVDRSVSSSLDLLRRLQACVDAGGWTEVEGLFELFLPRDLVAVGQLVEILRRSPERRLRSWSALALGRIGGREATDALIGAMSGDPDGSVRVCAAKALGKIADAPSVSALIGALGNPSDPRLSLTAAASLGLSGHQHALPSLIDRVRAERDPSVLAMLFESVARIGGAIACRDLGEIGNSVAVEEGTRAGAIATLGRIANAEASESLLTLVRSSGTPRELRRAALESLEEVDPTPAVSRTLEAFYHTIGDPEFQARALRTLGAVGGEDACEVLWRLYSTESRPALRRSTVLAMARTEAERARPDIERIARSDPEPTVSALAREVLARLSD